MDKVKILILLVLVGMISGCDNYFHDNGSTSRANDMPPGDSGCGITLDAVYNETIAFIDINYDSSLMKVFSSLDETEIERVVNCMFDLKGSFSMTDSVNDTRLVVSYKVRAEYLANDSLWQFTRLIYE